MANKEHFKQEEIPYGILAKFGLTQEMIEDLPQNVIHRLLSSRTTPVLPIVTENIDGETILSYARISLIRLDDGSVDVYFIPKWVDEDLEEFSIDQQEQLKAGRVVKADLEKGGTLLCTVRRGNQSGDGRSRGDYQPEHFHPDTHPFPVRR